MLESMTGYGRGTATNERFSINVELKAVNGKNFEVYCKVPGAYLHQEIEIKNRLSSQLIRGKITLFLSIETYDKERSMAKVRINQELIAAYYHQLKAVSTQLGLPSEIPLATILSLPDVITETQHELEAEEWELALQALDQATTQLVASRRQEGAALEAEIHTRIQNLENLLAAIQPYENQREANIRNRLAQSLTEFSQTFAISEDRFGQELIYYIERLDINEEKVRIQAHLKHFLNTLHSEVHQGRKFTFIMQELWRETNTLGVKANDADIQNIVVNMKDEIEKIKELLMNVL